MRDGAHWRPAFLQIYLNTLLNPLFFRGRSASRWALACALAGALVARTAPAALTASLDRPGGPLREHDVFSLVLTLSNTGTSAVTNLAATLRLSEPDSVAVEASPLF